MTESQVEFYSIIATKQVTDRILRNDLLTALIQAHGQERIALSLDKIANRLQAYVTSLKVTGKGKN